MVTRFIILSLMVLFCFSNAYAQTHRPEVFLNSVQGSKTEGLQIYQHFCSNCHAAKPLISMGAPRIGHEADWAARLLQDVAVLYQHTEEGYHAMPARGGCFECSDKQLILALVEMLPKNKKIELLNKLLDYKKITK